MIIDFEKDSDNRWYAIIPNWEGDRSELEMVQGADKMLDLLSQGDKDLIGLFFSLVPLENCSFVLDKIKDTPDIGGATYVFDGYVYGVYYKFELWLCDVTAFVFGAIPDKIYVRL